MKFPKESYTHQLFQKNLFTVGFISLLILISGCDSSGVDETSDKYSLQYSNSNVNLSYVGKVEGKNLSLSLRVSNDKEEILSTTNTLDVTSEGYRYNISDELIEIARNLQKKVSNNESVRIKDGLLGLIDQYMNEHAVSNFGKEELQGIFYYLSIFRTINRYNQDMRDNGSAEFNNTAYGGYIYSLSPYMAEEDISVNVNDFKEYVLQKEAPRLSKDDTNKMTSLLNEEIGKIIKSNPAASNNSVIDYKDFKKLLTNINSKSQQMSVEWIDGDDCGCCGNYEGKCWFAAGLCYGHDYLCQSCEPRWFCLSGCKEGSC